ncbi:hypothetical protein [Bailinhaonella thermotolerans]|uniref:hypothetical protein n=1 Tax=Bailinhaonella thermotolerans TaxID=1070861 RepID=UPI0011C3DE85|nr:hypothetical protein [Bailinhaonella thermotolerans]
MRVLVKTALALALLSGCAAQASATPAPRPEGVSERQWRLELARADCMRDRGFAYIPHVQQARTTELQRRVEAGDLAATAESRARYGYRMFAQYVYPDDPASGALVTDGRENPNPPGRLNESQAAAYADATAVCVSVAYKKALNKDVQSYADVLQQRAALRAELRARRVDKDPELVRLAGAFGDCLAGKGYTVESRTPSALADRGERRFGAELKKASRAAKGELTAARAKPYLTREIKDARDDFSCGKSFYTRYLPIDAEITARIDAEFGR